MLHRLAEVFLWLLGLCVGSFLNVVIYRMPRGLSIADPVRSFCPSCGRTIAWYDNLPLLSWVLLRGRCRHCGSAISVQYPLVEGLTGLGFLLVYHLLVVMDCRAGIGAAQWPVDLPILLTWLVLVGGLVACSAMDVVSYAVDTRVTNLVLVAGILGHAFWPRAELLAGRATAGVAAAVAAFLVAVLMLWWTVWRGNHADERGNEPPGEDEPGSESVGNQVSAWAGYVSVLVLVGLAGLVVYSATAGQAGLRPVAAGAVLSVGFAAVVLAGGQRRASDTEIAAVIENEQPQARLAACKELVWLSPVMLALVAGFALLAAAPAASQGWRDLVSSTRIGQFNPLGGAALAIHGAVVGAAAGWTLRIVFTLVFGREAFGIGDIYILAAAGAAAGWDIALLGLLFSVGLALAGWVVGLLLKVTTMIPFGPWLGLGFMLALWWSRPAHRIADGYRDTLTFAWKERPELLLMLSGLMLVGAAGAILLARLIRR